MDEPQKAAKISIQRRTIRTEEGNSAADAASKIPWTAIAVIGLTLGLAWIGARQHTDTQNERERTEQARQNESATRNKAAWEARAEEERTRQKLIEHATRAENK